MTYGVRWLLANIFFAMPTGIGKKQMIQKGGDDEKKMDGCNGDGRGGCYAGNGGAGRVK
jgi:hypothetical protein